MISSRSRYQKKYLGLMLQLCPNYFLSPNIFSTFFDFDSFLCSTIAYCDRQYRYLADVGRFSYQKIFAPNLGLSPNNFLSPISFFRL